MIKEGYTSNERIKEESDFLRGNISGLLHDGGITHFPSEVQELSQSQSCQDGNKNF